MRWLEKLLRSKVVVLTAIVLPGLWTAWPILRQDPTVMADPLKYLLHHYGFVACILLATVLTFTPLRVLFPGWGVAQALNRHRRRVGVSAFCYGAVHLSCRFLYQGGWPTFWKDMRKPFLMAGMGIFLIPATLTATSFNAAVCWMGGRRWKNLHRLAYVAAGLAAYHQAAARKIFPVQVYWIFGPLAALELARIIRQRIKPRPPPAATAPPPAAANFGP